MAELDTPRLSNLIAPYTEKPWVRGIYLVGSASRPFRDHISDFDIEVAVDDAAFAGMPLVDRHTYEIDPGPPRRVKHEFLLRAWSELESLTRSTRDLDHYPFQNALVQHDPSGDLRRLLDRIAALPESLRDIRCRVHFVELAASVSRTSKCLERGDAVNTRLMAAAAVAALVKLTFLVREKWPPMLHWAREELSLAGVAASTVETIERVLSSPELSDVAEFMTIARSDLDGAGMTFHANFDDLRTWAFLSDEGRAAFIAWGSR